MNEIYHFTRGSTPILISAPHAGTLIPEAIAARMTPEALVLPDTDWHVDRLYDFAPSLGAGLITATHSRYVVDLNRDPSGKPLYPGADNSEFVPLKTFASEAIYRPGQEPDPLEIEARREGYWQPYHARIADELDRLIERFGIAVLWDGHSIVSRVPRFFEGRLPDFNLGSVRGKSADNSLVERIMAILRGAAGFSSILDGRFTGGHITRFYGRPESGIHALQLEMAEAAYLDEAAPRVFDAKRAQPLKSVLREIVTALIGWASERAR